MVDTTQEYTCERCEVQTHDKPNQLILCEWCDVNDDVHSYMEHSNDGVIISTIRDKVNSEK